MLIGTFSCLKLGLFWTQFRPEMCQNRPGSFSQFFAPNFREIVFAKSFFAFREISRNSPLYSQSTISLTLTSFKKEAIWSLVELTVLPLDAQTGAVSFAQSVLQSHTGFRLLKSM